MAGHGFTPLPDNRKAMAGHGHHMGSPGMTTIEVPIVLRDRLRRGKAHQH